MEEKPYRICYQFRFDKIKDNKEFKIVIDPKTVVMESPANNCALDWTRLEYKQCTCCKLAKEENPYCPIALNIARVVETFKDNVSYEKCTVCCITPERSYFKKTSLMEGLSSLFGLIMATSACPQMSLFRPMARFHLPFASTEETAIRSIAMYLLGQYFIFKDNGIPDLELKKLYAHYETIKILNACLLERLRDVSEKDCDKNAIIIFHSICALLSDELSTNLRSLRPLFERAIR